MLLNVDSNSTTFPKEGEGEIDIFRSKGHSSNASFSMAVTVEGILIVIRDLHLENAFWPIDRRPSKRV
jgi:hypothetical protein